MPTAIDDLLAVETLTGMIKTFSDQAENRSCSALFARAARPLYPEGDSASWDEVQFSRHLAPVSGPDSPHTRAKRLGRSKRSSSRNPRSSRRDSPPRIPTSWGWPAARRYSGTSLAVESR